LQSHIVLAVVAILAVPGVALPAVSIPSARFAVVDGWLEIRVQRDDRPGAITRLRVLDATGLQVAGGETDRQGFASFPRPKGDIYIIFDLGSGLESPIRLRFPGKSSSVVPNHVLLAGGKKPCCLVSSFRRLATADNCPGRWIFVEASLGVVCLGGAVFLYQRKRPGKQSPRLLKEEVTQCL